MWLPKALYELFKTNKEIVDTLYSENYALKIETGLLKTQLATTQANFNWLTGRVNQLEVERAQLMEKAYGIKTIVPEIARQPVQFPQVFSSDLFEDVGDQSAKQLGYPSFESQFANSPKQ